MVTGKRRLPIFRTFGASLAYLAGNAGRLFAALWLPTALLMAAITFAMPDYLKGIATFSPDPSDPASMKLDPNLIRAMGIMMGASVLFYPMLTVASLVHLVRGDQQKLPFYLAFGGDEIRIFGAYIVFILMLGAVYMVGALGVMAVALSVAVISKAAAGGVMAIGAVAFLIALFWLMLRMSLIFPAAIATRSLGVEQSWRATKGNSLRLFFYWILAMAPMVLMCAAYFAIALPGMIPVYHEIFAAGGNQAAIDAATGKLMEYQASLYDMSKPGFWLYAAATYVYTIAITALMNVFSGVAWRYLSDAPARVGGEPENA